MSKTEPTARSSTKIDSTRSDIDAFIAEMTATKTSGVASTGRLIFALDATMSRQETWDAACSMQGDMFRTVASIGGLNVQLVYYRGLDECRASRWVTDPEQLAKLMIKINCHAGHTQIGKVLTHAKRETGLLKVAAVVFVGDAFEEEADEVVSIAQQLGQLNTPVFMFQEGGSRTVERVYARSLRHRTAPIAASIADRQTSSVSCSSSLRPSPSVALPHWKPARAPMLSSCSVSCGER